MTVTASRIPASIELSVSRVLDTPESFVQIPLGSSIYLVDVGKESDERFADAAKSLRVAGYNPVPHFAARRFKSHQAFESRLSALAQAASITQVLAIGGGLSEPAGPFSSTMDMFETGLFQHYGVETIGIAGHPEGSPDFSDTMATEHLKQKQAYAAENGLELYIVTQFGFDAAVFIEWSETLERLGIDLPVHIGVSAPAKIPSLLKFAVLSGVGNSIQFLRRNALSVKALALGFDPEVVVAPIEDHWRNQTSSNIKQIHVYAFGGAKAANEWLFKRGSWQ
jgi:methylenetetrahydrofolate reductase (NADPH)